MAEADPTPPLAKNYKLRQSHFDSSWIQLFQGIAAKGIVSIRQIFPSDIVS